MRSRQLALVAVATLALSSLDPRMILPLPAITWPKIPLTTVASSVLAFFRDYPVILWLALVGVGFAAILGLGSLLSEYPRPRPRHHP
ncbi:MAG: hypothetical protein HYY50_03365 [Candidatus Kerfeldbacteria bacterium]|nr:hypothetical protein [Candidatus Kerfeldbacteria bacterium]